MKRKRLGQCQDAPSKRVKVDLGSNDVLLKQHYATVSTLRQYLAARLGKTSKRRRRDLLHYGRDSPAITEFDSDLVSLLDNVTVGTVRHDDDIEDAIDKDITIFTQQVAESTADITPTQGALKQTEVGYNMHIASLFVPASLLTIFGC
jgi:hypothetical protein